MRIATMTAPADQPLRDRFARHYADFAALWKHPGGRAAATSLDLLERVRIHKSRFFASSWAHYDTAAPGTLRLVPPAARLPELRRDYAAMQPMFLSPPPDFDAIIATLREAEDMIHAGPTDSEAMARVDHSQNGQKEERPHIENRTRRDIMRPSRSS